ncbi:MAG: sodium-independent anion transporter [Alphaproteobacteria bacterium]|nr:sodium-independent anion transporter [Alphaproteobacteria bacterium]
MPHLQTGFYPKSVTAWREGYGLASFKADALAALTVAIVALPLSMAIAIASHVSPERGLYTSIIGGFIISALGGSRFQIGGPAGAFIVLMASITDAQGLDGLFLATMMAGVILFVVGASGLGRLIRYVPHAVTVGFTAGIAVIIFASQIKDLFGLKLAGAEPGALLPKLGALAAASSTLNVAALGLAVVSIALIAVLRHYRPHWPSLLIAVCLASVLALLIPGAVETIASRFGGIPSQLPLPHVPEFSAVRLWALAPSAASLALLGGIESLLSAMVADSMSGRKHRTSTELMAQGVGNVASALFGGIVVTGTIARTATNVKAGAKTPISGMLHAVFLLLFMLVAAPLAGYIPLAALAGILALVCWNMADKAEVWRLLKQAKGESLVLAATFLLTIFVDLTTGILAGVVLAFVLSPRAFLKGPEQFKH